MEPLAIWAICLAATSLFFFVLEVMIPSGGLLGILSGVALMATVACLFLIDPLYGWIGVVGSLILVPTAIAVALKLFPHTPIGRRMILADAQKVASTRYSSDDTNDAYDNLVGQSGVVVSELRPVGVVDFDGRRVDCLAERGTIEPGTRVTVVGVAGIEVKVRPT